jgi:hypothetical protein
MFRETTGFGLHERLSRALLILALWRVATVDCCVWAVAQQPCSTGVHIEGIITDPTSALIPGAQVKAAPAKQQPPMRPDISSSTACR